MQGRREARARGSAGAERVGAGGLDARCFGGATTKGTVTIDASKSTAPVANADAVLRAAIGRFRACYQRGLQDDPGQQGKIVLTIAVQADGGVSAASVARNDGLSPNVASCVAAAARNLQFGAPGGDGSTITVPITFAKTR